MVKTLFTVLMMTVAVATLTYVFWLREKYGYRKPRSEDGSDMNDSNIDPKRDESVQKVYTSEYEDFEESTGVVSLAKRRVLKSGQTRNAQPEDISGDRSPSNGDEHKTMKISGGTYTDE